MKIAIKTHDNDFYNTFHGVLKTILEGYKWTENKVEDKEKLAYIINHISFGCYLLFQNAWTINDNVQTIEKNNGHLKEYLQVKPEQILLNKEVDEYLKTVEWDNGETFILDTDLDFIIIN